MSAVSTTLLLQLVCDHLSRLQKEARERAGVSARLCELSNRVCDLTTQANEDVRRTCLNQKEKLQIQRERLIALSHRLSAQCDKWKKVEAKLLAKLSEKNRHQS